MTRLRGRLRHDEPLARYTTWRVGGPAERLFEPADAADLAAYLHARPDDEPLFWLGLGSNLLVRDGGLRGSVIRTQRGLGALQELPDGGVRAGAGVPCAKLARLCSRRGLVGAAFFAGIPGTVGGALAMNAGAWGGETWTHVESVETVDRSGACRERGPEAFQVGYRRVEGNPGEWFTAATFRFRPGGDPGALASRVRELLAERAERQPTGLASGGSVFRNPPGDHAARLIEAAGLKGTVRGGARISEKHANFIVHEGDATAADIEALIELARERVAAVHGVTLEPEVRIVGEARVHD
ncbi:UDP-N-acetylmuramate dehydrogenase [Sediminicurvatus halobius]|uniref:UDP-N-acetylenolpyruvoylglucosamine reductase n=1 Tax=Sediminicurvatus halobius TaxID=2182432 RepID=A0A2U2N7W9_9GAMM|nr:UDP-N-acetylmuramate dehydrogenase [Spiribacter halobius]PWG65173.1 UDP-N-acetylenolpyruvoylglucosamine reductase [Spiribacter halobius]UEX78876.1 UDP-N-acetylmuramate dehydrogenase [Spiribacter halobius]